MAGLRPREQCQQAVGWAQVVLFSPAAMGHIVLAERLLQGNLNGDGGGLYYFYYVLGIEALHLDDL